MACTILEFCQVRRSQAATRWPGETRPASAAFSGWLISALLSALPVCPWPIPGATYKLRDQGARLNPSGPRVLLVGAGAIGGVLGTLLCATPAQLTVLTTNALISQALRERGFRLRGDAAARAGRPQAVVSEAPPGAEFDWILLAVQPPQVEAAARGVLPALAPKGQLVC